MSFKLVLEMESGLVGTKDQMPVVDSGSSTVEPLGEFQSMYSVVDSQSDLIEKALAATGELQEVENCLEDSIAKNGGVSEQTAKMTEMALEVICCKLGVSPRQDRLMPTMEAFGSSNSRLVATTVTMEGIKEQAVRILKLIRDSLVKVWEVAKTLFKNLLKSRVALEKHIVYLQSLSSKATDSPKVERFESGAKAFSIQGTASVDSIKTVLSDSIKLVDISKQASKFISEVVKNTIDGNKDLDTKPIIDKFATLGDTTGSKSNSGSSRSYGNFTNGRYISIVDDARFGFQCVLISIGRPSGVKQAPDIAAPNKSEIEEILKLALANIKTLAEFDKLSNELTSINKAAISLVDKMLKSNVEQAKRDDDGTSKSKMAIADNSRLRVKMTVTNSFIAMLGTKIPGLIFSSSKEAASYALEGLKNLGALSENQASTN